MKLLLDTHVLLWVAVGEPELLPASVRALIEDQDNQVFFSAASIWEVAVKSSKERTGFKVDPFLLRRHLLENDYLELVVAGNHAAAVSTLPPIHKDPFDRVLVAQAQAEGLTLLTTDSIVANYPGPIRQINPAEH